MGSIWVLALVLKIGAHEIILQPRAIYNEGEFSKIFCEEDKYDLEWKTGIPATCYRLGMEI